MAQRQITLDDDAAPQLRQLADAPQQQGELSAPLPPAAPPAADALTLAALAQRITQLEAQVADLQEAWDELEDAGWSRANEAAVREAEAAGEQPIPFEQAMAEIGYKRS